MEAAKGSGKDDWDYKRRSGYGGYGWHDGWKHSGGKPRTPRSPRDKGAEKGKGGEKHNPKRGDFHQGHRKVNVKDGVIQD